MPRTVHSVLSTVDGPMYTNKLDGGYAPLLISATISAEHTELDAVV